MTLDKDFSDLAMLPRRATKIIWMRCGDRRLLSIERILRANFSETAIEKFDRHRF